jgi:hypothetical protein
MPNYVMLNQPNKMDWLERPAAQAGNFLYQMALANHAAKLRSEEAIKQREYENKKLEANLDLQLGLHGFETVPESEAAQPGDLKIGGRLVRRAKPQIYTFGGKEFIVTGDGKLTPIKELTKSDKYKIGETKEFEIGDTKETLIYTDNPADKVEGLEGWKRTGISAPRYKPAQTNVEVKLPPVESAAAKEYGKLVGETAGKRIGFADEARSQNMQLEIVKRTIQQGARTGWGEETLLNLRSMAESFGINTGDLSGQELIRKTSNEMALRLRNPESGLGLTGNTSNKDLEFLKQSVIGLQRTERGNLKIIDVMQKFNNLKISLAKEQQRIIKENKGIPPYDLDEQLMNFVDKYKIFDDKDRADIKKSSQNVINTGIHKASGRKTIQLEDGTWEYAD